MGTSAPDERVKNVELTDDMLSVALMDGRVIIVPLVWYPKLLHASGTERNNWRIAGGGYGIHWPDVDEDLRRPEYGRVAPWGAGAPPTVSKGPVDRRAEKPGLNSPTGRSSAKLEQIPRR